MCRVCRVTSGFTLGGNKYHPRGFFYFFSKLNFTLHTLHTLHFYIQMRPKHMCRVV
jgi:hypothetical protein